MGKGGEKSEKTLEVVNATESDAKKFDRKDFYVSQAGEPHAARRKLILQKHPEIVDLMKPDIRPVPYVVAMVVAQLVISAYAKHMSYPFFFAIAYLVGGTLSHSLALMTHECSHNLIFENLDYNFYFAIFNNIAMGIPSAASFKIYHMEHHQFQGSREKDVDIPTFFEGKHFKGPLLKILYLFLQPFLYAGRPALVRPKDMSNKQITNFIVIGITDALLVRFFGVSALFYLVTSCLLGFGLHPMAGHLIAEHYVFDGNGEFETYSYYGFLNKLAWNVGYHNEHHDFPRVPGWKLPEITRIAPEFYENLPKVDCWIMCLVNFVMDPTISPFCRVERS